MRYLLIAAILPAAVLMLYVYKKDKVEKEPGSLLILLVALGALACLPASLLEKIGFLLTDNLYCSDLELAFIENFLIVAVAEEACKYFFVKLKTWKSNQYNCSFDGMVYCVFVSLGFAALENVKYAITYGSSVLLMRAIFSVPGHMTFGVFMGRYYSRAKREEAYGRFNNVKPNLVKALVIPVLLHGFYDFCLSTEIDLLYTLFFVFVFILDVAAIKTVKRESENDAPLYNWENY